MKKLLTYSLLLLGLAFTSCDDDDVVVVDIVAEAVFEPKNGSNVSGIVTFTERDGMVTMVAEVEGLTNPNHAIHIHAEGDCSADDGSSAGGHWNPNEVAHGTWGVSEFHAGDIGNLTPNSNGIATISRETDLWCVGCSDATKNVLGKGMIIHEGPDDFSSQPSGAAGPRVACAVIVMK